MSSADTALNEKTTGASDEHKDSTNDPPTSSLATEVKADESVGPIPAEKNISSPTIKSASPKRGGEHKVRFSAEEAPPAKPPRPQSPQERALATLIEAFPSIDTKVVKAVLHASGGQLEPAFNALLGMSDPDFTEDAPPPPPPRPTAEQQQLHNDELYARQLANHYNSTERSRSRPQTQQRWNNPGTDTATTAGAGSNERDYSFFDDELPVIQQNIKQGFLQTQTKVNKWISDFRKRIDGEDDDGGDNASYSSDQLYADPAQQQQQRHNFGASQAEQLRGIQRMSAQRNGGYNNNNTSATDRARSRSATRYDADPQLLDDDFSRLAMEDNDDDATMTPPPQKPTRPLANPDLFRTSVNAQPPQAGPVDEVDALVRRPLGSAGKAATTTPTSTRTTAASATATPSPTSATRKKWQPLTSVAPAPEAEGGDTNTGLGQEEEEDDPFSLGDSDGEVEGEDKKQDLLKESSERLKRAAAEKGKGKGRKMSLEAKEDGSGTRDREAEEILKGK